MQVCKVKCKPTIDARPYTLRKVNVVGTTTTLYVITFLLTVFHNFHKVKHCPLKEENNNGVYFP